ncbi:MAG TPA: transposase [Spirochaetes bacterium]|nr:transposase [Spirochaetota bacterium]
MKATSIHECECPDCQQDQNHTSKQLHHQMNLLLSRLNEQQRRWYAALESKKDGHGGIRSLSQITGIDEKTISRGIRELEEELSDQPIDRVRLEGGGRKKVEKKGSGA